jgi:hypothetical protein
LGVSRCESFPFNYTGPGWDSISVHHKLYTATYHLFLLKSEMVSLPTLTAEFRSETSCRVGLCKEAWIQEQTFSPFQPCDDYTRRHSTLRVLHTHTDALRRFLQHRYYFSTQHSLTRLFNGSKPCSLQSTNLIFYI